MYKWTIHTNGFFFTKKEEISQIIHILIIKGKKSLCRRPKQELGVGPHSGPYLLVLTLIKRIQGLTLGN